MQYRYIPGRPRVRATTETRAYTEEWIRAVIETMWLDPDTRPAGMALVDLLTAVRLEREGHQ